MVTILTDNHPKNPYVGKGEDGVKAPLRGKYEIKHLSLKQLVAYEFNKHQFMIAGFNSSKGRYQAGDLNTRLSKENWEFRDGQLMLIADIDGKWFEGTTITLPNTAEDVYTLLTTLNPLLKDVGMAVVPSSSNGLNDIFTSWHVYAKVTNVQSVMPWAEAHHRLCFDKGYGVAVHSKSYGGLSRSLFDLTIYQTQKQYFEGTRQDNARQAGVFGDKVLDLKTTKPKPRTTERDINDLITDHLIDIEDEIAEFDRKHPDKARARNGGIVDLSQVINVPEATTIGNQLLKFLAGKAPQTKYCSDPMEPEEGSARASLTWVNSNLVILHSFLHGETNYRVNLNYNTLAQISKASELTWEDAAARLLQLRTSDTAKALTPIASNVANTYNTTGAKLTKTTVLDFLKTLIDEKQAPADIYEQVADGFGYHKYALLAGSGKPLYTYVRNGYDIEFLSADSLRAMSTNKKMWVDGWGDYLTAFNALNESSKRREFLKVVFDPSDNTDPDELNIWQGFETVGKTGDPKPFTDYVFNVLADGDEKIAHTLTMYIAHMIQQPEVNPMWAVVLISKNKGTGKGTIQRFVEDLVGLAHTYKFANASSIMRNFNSKLARSIYAYMEEMIVEGDELESMLKDLITQSSMTMEPKHVDETTIKCFQRYIFATNNAKGVPFTSRERRLFLVDVNEDRIGDEVYWEGLNKWWYNGGKEITMDYLENYQFDKLPLNAPITDKGWSIAKAHIYTAHPVLHALYTIMFEDGYMIDIPNSVGAGNEEVKYNGRVWLNTIADEAVKNRKLNHFKPTEIIPKLIDAGVSKDAIMNVKSKSQMEMEGHHGFKAIGLKPDFNLALEVVRAIAYLPRWEHVTTIEEIKKEIKCLEE